MNSCNKTHKQTDKVKNMKSIFFCLIFSLLIFLSGCVHYDIGVNFYSQHHGEIVQHVSVTEQLSKFSPVEINKWLNSLEDRTKKLKGKVKKLSENELLFTIPFYSSTDLVEKFNLFFNPSRSFVTSGIESEDLNKAHLETKMSIQQHNLLLAEYNNLSIEIDLRDLEIFSKKGNKLIRPDSLLDLEFTLSTPWHIKNIHKNNKFNENFDKEKQRISWKLEAGKINRIETVFWTPNYLGLGFVCIFLTILVGIYIKYRVLFKV
ncbi:DUF3153 domain-containing protein [Candidatus Atelocyanobacterium thalassae]|uniref:DUF3153 domain-containing protein n=1 Tax=cyanobacterium endosymbiont of Braarudosphaera bigelowii TaxID=1285375 RepID=A0ABM7U3P8_9CHRO|nr:DUF3153 domain-containing protein [Candidatus Atelocyanobacterium thalassa]BDA39195.1 hypothetical protein CPARK_000003400 [cyanobacterium endosymbiont of Braarudosphaera bigelowii]